MKLTIHSLAFPPKSKCKKRMPSSISDTSCKSGQILSNKQLFIFSYRVHHGIILLPPNTTLSVDIKLLNHSHEHQTDAPPPPQQYALFNKYSDLHKAFPMPLLLLLF